MTELIKNQHPGIILLEEFLKELNMSMSFLAEAIDVPKNRIHHIVKGTRGIT